MHLCQCICLCQCSLVRVGVLWGTGASASVRGLHCLAFCSVRSCACASSCFELNKPVLLAVFCCPHVHESLLFIVGQFYIQAWFLGCSPSLPSLNCFHSIYYIILVWLAFCGCLRSNVRVRVRDRKVFSKINATLSYNFCKLLIKLFFSLPWGWFTWGLENYSKHKTDQFRNLSPWRWVL